MIALLITWLLAPDWTLDVSAVAKVTLKYEHGAVSILRIEREALAKPTHLPRWRGRYEARVGDGSNKTLDLVRFDFPLLAPAEEADDSSLEAVELGRKLRQNVTATTLVRVPLPPGASSVTIYDTASKQSVSAPLTSFASPTAPLTAAGRSPPAAAAAGTRK